MINNKHIKLTNEQIQMLENLDKNIIVLGATGTGKTQILVERIKIMVSKGIKPENILVLSFTNAAISEIKERISEYEYKNDILIRTFHSFAFRMLKKYGTDNFTLIDNSIKLEIIEKVLKQRNDLILDVPQNYKDISKAISNFKSDGIKVCDLKKELEVEILELRNKMGENNDRSTNKFTEKIIEKKSKYIAYHYYEQEKNRLNFYDFEDLILNMINLLKNEKNRNKINAQFQYILVDEIENLNFIEQILLKQLSPDSEKLFCTTSVEMQIYKFKKGNLNFATQLTNTELMVLKENFRNPAKILEASKELIKINTEKKLDLLDKKKLFVSKLESKNEKALKYIQDIERFECKLNKLLEYIQNIKTTNDESEKIIYKYFTNQESETNFIHSEITRLVKKGYSYKDFAILYRGNQEVCLKEVKKRFHNPLIYPLECIPYKDYNKFELCRIELVLHYLKSVFLEKNEFYFDETKFAFFKEILDTINIAKKKVSEGNGLMDIIEYFLELLKLHIENKYKDSPELKELSLKNTFPTMQNLVKVFQENIDKYESVEELFYEINELLYQELEDLKNTVSLRNIHSSKGKEYKVVFLIACNEGLMPSSKSFEIDEERNLMNAAITRAKEKLYITGYMYHNKDQKSQFISELENYIN